MKKLLCLMMAVIAGIICIRPGMADTYVYCQPGEGDVSKETAMETALCFLEESFSFSRREWPTEMESAYFGPGNQWLEKEEENCWILSFRNEMPMRAAVQIHGKTGEIVSWECSGGERLTNFYDEIGNVTQQHFYDALPQSREWLNAGALYERALADFAFHSGKTMTELEAQAAVRIAFGLADHNGWLVVDEQKDGAAIQFHISCTFPSQKDGEGEQWFYSVSYRMLDGEILTQFLSCNDEQKAFRMNPLKTK